MAIELRISNEIESGNLAITVSPHDAPIIQQFLEEAARNRILDKISIENIMQTLVRAKKKKEIGHGDNKDGA